MHAVGKRKWKVQLEENLNKEKKVKVLPSGVQVTGKMEVTSKGKNKTMGRGKAVQKEQVMHGIVAFEGLNGLECRKWWQETPVTDEVKKLLRNAGVHWAIQMPLFPIKNFKPTLRIMVNIFDRHTRKSTFQYRKHLVTVSFTPADFTRVFGILGRNGQKIEIKKHKMIAEWKEFWIKQISRNLTRAELDSIVQATKS